MPAYQAVKFYSSATDGAQSKAMSKVTQLLSEAAVPVGTTFQLQVRLSPLAPWVDLPNASVFGTTLFAGTAFIIWTLPGNFPYNEIRLNRSVGAGDVNVWAQGANETY
jgi:hypothetical protein